jgi:hypothetical protein
MLVEDPVFSGDIQECSNSEVQKHPVSLGTAKHCVDGRNQYPLARHSFSVGGRISQYWQWFSL